MENRISPGREKVRPDGWTERRSAARSVTRASRGRSGNGDGAIHADEHAAFCRQIHFLALASHDINRTAGKAESETTDGMAEDGADECAAAAADGSGNNVAFNVVFLFDDLAFRNFHVFPLAVIAVLCWLLDGEQTHLNRDEAAVNFD